MTVESVPDPIKRFRHKPKSVCAWLAGGDDPVPAWNGLAVDAGGTLMALVAGQPEVVSGGDVVVQDAEGNLWVCSQEMFADLYEPDRATPVLSDADRLSGTALAANGTFKGIPMLDLCREDAIAALAISGMKIQELVQDNRVMAEELDKRKGMPKLIIPGR